MITQIRANATYGRQLMLPVLLDDASGFTVRSVEGLGPSRANIITSAFATLDGSSFQAASVENRNIVITIGLEPYHGSLTVKDLREQLYSVFMPKNQVDLRFYDHSLSSGLDDYYDTVGYVESCEPNIFSQDPEIVISIICTDPFFYDTVESSFTANTVQDTTMTEVEYLGTAATGFELELPITATGVTQLIVYRETPSGLVDTFDLQYTFQQNDVLFLSTKRKAKTVEVLRSNVLSSILSRVNPVSRWVDLNPGTNKIRVWSNTGSMQYTCKYTALYGGL